MDSRLFRYLFENISNAIVMTGCTWDKGAQNQIRYTYSCEMMHNNLKANRRNCVKQVLCGSNPISLFFIGTFSIEDVQRLIYAIHHGGVDTVIIPYVPPIHRFLILQTMMSCGMNDSEIIEFIKAPYLYLKNSMVRRFFFIYGNGKILDKTGEELYPGYYFEPQDEEILNIIEEMEGYRIPVVKAGFIVDSRMLFYLGHFGVDLRMVWRFIQYYPKSTQMDIFEKREMQKMLLFYLKEFGDPCMDSLTIFCGPIEIMADQTDCVFNATVMDKSDSCHADIEEDEGRCVLKCMLHNDCDVCRYHRTEAAELRTGILLLGNMRLSGHLPELKRHYHIVEDQVRIISLPNCGHISSWDKDLLDFGAKKNALFWMCSLQAQTSDCLLREIKMKNARNRIIGLTEEYGCCFNGFLTEKTS